MEGNQPVLIAGAGIGGLAAALGIARTGLPTLVLERAAQLGEIGAGIQLGPNAFRSFDYLGIGEAARALAVHVRSMKLMDAVTAEEIAILPLDETFSDRFKNPYAVIHRGELHRALLKACQAHPSITLRGSSEVDSYEQSSDGVTVRLAGGERVVGSALIAADGLRSNVRAQLLGDGPPRVSGHTTYRSVIAADRMPVELRWDAMTIWAGPKCHIVHYPLSDWTVFNLVVTSDNGAFEAVAGEPATHDEVRGNFEHIHPTARQIIELGENWKRWVLCDREPVEEWRDGRVVLLGDAAHPMMQYLAQGACMALEDAVRLAHEIERCADDLPQALEAYRVARKDRTARVQKGARRMGEELLHVSGEKAVERNKRLKGMTAHDFHEAASWLYSGSGLD